MLLTITTVCLSLFASHGAAKGWSDAVSDAETLQAQALGCDSPTLSQDLNDQSRVLGYAASACTEPQRQWMLYQEQKIIADQLVCQCKVNYYDKIKTLADVGVWLKCVGPAYAMLFAAVNPQHALEASSLDQLYTDCSTLSSSGAFPPVDPALDRAVQVVDTVLDWRGKLLNIMTSGLQKEVQGIILSAIIDGVHEAAISKANDFIESKITQGYVPPANSGVLRRQNDNSTVTPEGELISELTGIEVTIRLVPNTGFTMDDVQAGLKRVLTGQNFTDTMTTGLNGNVTNMQFSVQKGSTTANSTASASGTATSSGSAATNTANSASHSSTESAVGMFQLMGLHLPMLGFGAAGVLYVLAGL